MKSKNKYGAVVLNECTKSYLNFSAEMEQTEMLMIFIFLGDEYIQENKERARKTLIEVYHDPKNDVSAKLTRFFQSEQADPLFNASFYEQYFGQMAFARSIDNCITYFKEILAEVVVQKPEVLKSKEVERLDFILSHANFDDLLRSISEKKISELFYKGLLEIEKFFIDRLGIEIFKRSEDRETLTEMIRQRNLVVHNRGRVSKEYVNDFPKTSFKVGDNLSFEYGDVSKANITLSNILADLDIELAKKFKLDTLKFN